MQSRVLVVVRVDPSGGWSATVPDGPEVHVGGATLGRCQAALRRAMGGPAGFGWDLRIELPPALDQLVGSARRHREVALAAQRRSTEATQEAISRLSLGLAESVSMRDIALLVGVSHQRVQQVLSTGRGD